MSGRTETGDPAKPLMVRLTRSERAALECKAGSTPLSTYARQVILHDQSERRCRRRRVAPDHNALARLLAFLGSSGLSENLHRIACAIERNGWQGESTLLMMVKRACADVSSVRATLLRALGIKIEHHDPQPITLTRIFAQAAGRTDASIDR